MFEDNQFYDPIDALYDDKWDLTYELGLPAQVLVLTAKELAQDHKEHAVDNMLDAA